MYKILSIAKLRKFKEFCKQYGQSMHIIGLAQGNVSSVCVERIIGNIIKVFQPSVHFNQQDPEEVQHNSVKAKNNS